MCNYCAGIFPKDEYWWEDMDRDAAEYLGSLKDDDAEEDVI